MNLNGKCIEYDVQDAHEDGGNLDQMIDEDLSNVRDNFHYNNKNHFINF